MASEKNITMRQYNGVDYDTLYPKTIASQVEGVYSKDEILSNATKKLYGLDNSAVPDDVFALLRNYIPHPYGLLIVQVLDGDGNGVPAKINVSPSIGEVSVFYIMDDGRYSILAEPGVYTLTPATNYPFSTVTTQAQTVTVKRSEPIVVNFSATKNMSGEFDFIESTEIRIPEFVNLVDLFAVGGGASGRASLASGTPSSAGGGGGGYTATLLSQNLSGKLLKISIGAGGKSATVTGNNVSGMNGGGDTKITVNEKDILIANGGKGIDGGSGGGVGKYSEYQGNGGSDGSDGENGGTGQGTTTRKFGEETNTLYSGGGGGAHALKNTQYKGVGGKGGGGDGMAFYTTTAGTYTGKSGTTYGGGGGGICVKRDSDSTAVTLISGAGYQGLASIRW